MIRARPGTIDLMRYGAGHIGDLESVAGALQHILRVLPRFTTLSNWAVCESYVSLEPDGGRKIFSKMSSGDELPSLEAHGAKIGDLAWPSGISTSFRAWPASQNSQNRYDRPNAGRSRKGAAACYDFRLSCPRHGQR